MHGQGVCITGEHACLGACMAGHVHSGGHAWPGGHAWLGGGGA